jgi:type III secretory pathway component EscR
LEIENLENNNIKKNNNSIISKVPSEEIDELLKEYQSFLKKVKKNEKIEYLSNKNERKEFSHLNFKGKAKELLSEENLVFFKGTNCYSTEKLHHSVDHQKNF